MQERFEDGEIIDVIMRIYYDMMLGDRNKIAFIDYIKFNEFCSYVQDTKEYVSNTFDYMITIYIPTLLKYFFRLTDRVEGAIQKYRNQPQYPEDMNSYGLLLDEIQLKNVFHLMQQQYQWGQGNTLMLIQQAQKESSSLKTIMVKITTAIGEINHAFNNEQRKKEENQRSAAEKEDHYKELWRQRWGGRPHG